nr:MAG TPA: hypothetical protein [Caudoviricetes sp.]
MTCSDSHGTGIAQAVPVRVYIRYGYVRLRLR